MLRKKGAICPQVDQVDLLVFDLSRTRTSTVLSLLPRSRACVEADANALDY